MFVWILSMTEELILRYKTRVRAQNQFLQDWVKSVLLWPDLPRVLKKLLKMNNSKTTICSRATTSTWSDNLELICAHYTRLDGACEKAEFSGISPQESSSWTDVRYRHAYPVATRDQICCIWRLELILDVVFTRMVFRQIMVPYSNPSDFSFDGHHER